MENDQEDTILRESIAFIDANPMVKSDQVPFHLLQSWIDLADVEPSFKSALAIEVFAHVLTAYHHRSKPGEPVIIEEDNFISLYNVWQQTLQFIYLDRTTEFTIAPVHLFDISIYDDLQLQFGIDKSHNKN